jgi:hypothetical protein
VQSFVFPEGKEGFSGGKKGDSCVQDDKLRMYGGFEMFEPSGTQESGL